MGPVSLLSNELTTIGYWWVKSRFAPVYLTFCSVQLGVRDTEGGAAPWQFGHASVITPSPRSLIFPKVSHVLLNLRTFVAPSPGSLPTVNSIVRFNPRPDASSKTEVARAIRTRVENLGFQ